MKKWIALLLALVMCLSLCACGGKKEQERNDELYAAVERANYVLKNEMGDNNTWCIVNGDFNSKTNVYTVSVSYNTEVIEETAISKYPNPGQDGLRKEYMKSMYEVTKGEKLDLLMEFLKATLGFIFTDENGDEMDIEIVYQFTDETGNITTY